jgi:hypothetical protein
MDKSLGMLASCTNELLAEIAPQLLEFRKTYAPYNMEYKVEKIWSVIKISNSVSEQLVRELRLRWIGLDKYGRLGLEQEAIVEVEELKRLNQLSWFALLVDAGNPTWVSIFFDTYSLIRKTFSKRKESDLLIKRCLTKLNMPLLRHRKAAKLWALRFKLISKHSLVKQISEGQVGYEREDQTENEVKL